ncbi:MAG TPA: hypothetical protein VF486_02905 [Actinomycetes bacterium]
MSGERLRTVAGVAFGIALAVALAWLSFLLFSGDDPTLVPSSSTAPATTATAPSTTLA